MSNKRFFKVYSHSAILYRDLDYFSPGEFLQYANWVAENAAKNSSAAVSDELLNELMHSDREFMHECLGYRFNDDSKHYILLSWLADNPDELFGYHEYTGDGNGLISEVEFERKPDRCNYLWLKENSDLVVYRLKRHTPERRFLIRQRKESISDRQWSYFLHKLNKKPAESDLNRYISKYTDVVQIKLES